MTELVAEFSGWNDANLRGAFTQACEYVSQQGSVSVVDAMYARAEAQAEVELAVYAASRNAIFNEPCTTSLLDLVQRQFDDIRMALGIAATGAATTEEAESLAASLGPQPPGAMREVVAATGLQELYDHIVRWLERVIASRPKDGGPTRTLALDADETIEAHLPTSNSSPADPLRLRQRP